MNRKEMMSYCPEEFEDELKNIIDEIEQRVNEIYDLLDIESISCMVDIEIAYDKAKDLAKDLY